MSQAVQGGNWQLTFLGSPRFIDPYPILFNTLSTGSSGNLTKYSNPAVDAALKEAQSTDDVAKRKQAYQAVQEALVQDFGLYFIIRQGTFNIFDKKTVKAFPVINDGLPDWTRIQKQSTK